MAVDFVALRTKTDAIMAGITGPLLASGLFDRVSTHEPKTAPGTGLTAAVWLARIRPWPGGSGLASVTLRLEYNVRLYTSMLAEPQDEIDPELTWANVAVMALFSDDFDLDGSIRNVDLEGESGEPLSSQAGYLNQDGKLMRVIDVLLPLIVNDVFDENQ